MSFFPATPKTEAGPLLRLLARYRRSQRWEVASTTRGTAGGWVAGHALGWGGQDATLDPKGSLEAVPRVVDACRLPTASVGMGEQLSSTDDAIGRPMRRTGESP